MSEVNILELKARDLRAAVTSRRTFAIISHPDAGKTTLTEKLLLYGGAIHLAGAVRAKATQRHTTSDWMEIEKQRGISISTSVLQFKYFDTCINLLDTPGHKDFSEDTYRTLTAADCAVMLIDAAKGVEPQTLKLFEVCKRRGIPIFTFINKMDRPSKYPLDLLDEVEKVLGLRLVPVTWPIGGGDRFKGVYDRHAKEVLSFQTEGEANVKGRLQPRKFVDLRDPDFKAFVNDDEVLETFLEELELLDTAGDCFSPEAVMSGKISPTYFGSAMNNFGVERFLQSFIQFAPCPGPHFSGEQGIEAVDPRFTAFIFKIQANMDPSHRDRVAFARICSGEFARAMTVTHSRLKKKIKLSMPFNFFAQERVVIERAWPGDIIGLLDTSGDLRIGDTLADPAFAQSIEYSGVPVFTPEIFMMIDIKDPMKRKQMKKGLEQLSEEGVIQLFRQLDFSDKDPVLGGVGQLQFEVLEHRLKSEYGVETRLIPMPFQRARWVSGNISGLESFNQRNDTRALLDRDKKPVLIFASEWALRWTTESHKDLKFSASPTS